MNRRILIAGIVAASALVALLAAGFGRDPKAVPFVLKGRAAPPFVLQRLDGQGAISVEGLAGRPAVINFWSTNCQGCKAEHALMQRAAQVYGAKGVPFVGVLYGEDPEIGRRYLRLVPSVYPTVIDPGGASAVDYGVAAVPETFFLDGDGKIVRKMTGQMSETVMVETMKSLLEEGA
jgi:cytochrome c biogenesis protein CcmG/thiol:disulfide interchange protein DsbE